MLRYGIPEYRLPKDILDWEIEGILNLGIEAKTNMSLGKDFSLRDLKEQEFDSVFLAVGAWAEQSLNVEGCDSQGVFSGIDFLEKFHSGIKVKIGKHVVVIGGGNTAMDAARCSLRLGAEKVTIVYRRSRNEMPANPKEIVEAEEEGVEYSFLSAPNRIIAENGKVAGIEVIKMELGEPDPSGRRRLFRLKTQKKLWIAIWLLKPLVNSLRLIFYSRTILLNFYRLPAGKQLKRMRILCKQKFHTCSLVVIVLLDRELLLKLLRLDVTRQGLFTII